MEQIDIGGPSMVRAAAKNHPSVAVGITPQMLPVIVTTCLSRGGTQMAKQDVIVKNPAAIQKP